MSEIKLGDQIVFFPADELDGAFAALIDIGYTGIRVNQLYKRVSEVVLKPDLYTVLLNRTAYQFIKFLTTPTQFENGANHVYEILKLQNNMRSFDGMTEIVKMPKLPFDVLNVIASHAGPSTQMKLKTYAKTTTGVEADKYEKWFKNKNYYPALIEAVKDQQIDIVKYIVGLGLPHPVTYYIDRGFTTPDYYSAIVDENVHIEYEALAFAILNSSRTGNELVDVLSDNVSGNWITMIKLAAFVGNQEIVSNFQNILINNGKLAGQLDMLHLMMFSDAAVLYFSALGRQETLFMSALKSFKLKYGNQHEKIDVYNHVFRAAIEGGSRNIMDVMFNLSREYINFNVYIDDIKTLEAAEWFFRNRMEAQTTDAYFNILEKLLEYRQGDDLLDYYRIIQVFEEANDHSAALMRAAIKGHNLEMLKIFVNDFDLLYQQKLAVCREAVESNDVEIIEFIFSTGYMNILTDRDRNKLLSNATTVDTAKQLIRHGLLPNFETLVAATKYVDLIKFYYENYRDQIFPGPLTADRTVSNMTVDTLKYCLSHLDKLYIVLILIISFDIDYLEYLWSLPDDGTKIGEMVKVLREKIGGHPNSERIQNYSEKLWQENEVMKYVKMLNYKNRLARLSL
jgi:hypothetical protein